MHVEAIELDVELTTDRLLDLFVLQLHTPDTTDPGGLGPCPLHVAEARGECLSRFARWLKDCYQPKNPNRPFFVLLPELSVPLQHLQVLRDIAKAADRPVFVIGGIEFLRFKQYRTLLNSMADMPNHAAWLAHGRDDQFVNAAFIALRDAQGEVRQFLQTKRNPSDPEFHKHFPCEETLLFQSHTQANGARLNFCVQICSDFASHDRVLELRKACEQAGSRPLDFTFVLQRNKDQMVPHFKRSIAAYFEPPDQKVDTSPGCLVFVNNANATCGESPHWGKSMLLFPYDKRWRVRCSPTYWLDNDGPHSHQAAIVRESGPTIYWLRYKPQYLVNRTPGSGQPGPFVENRAVALSLDNQVFPSVVEFSAIQPVAHWLISQWAQPEPRFINELRKNDRPAEVHTSLHEVYRNSLEAWRSALKEEILAQRLVAVYFSGDPGSQYSERGEPQGWTELRFGVRRFLELYAVLHLGFSKALDMRPFPTESGHAVVGGSTTFALLWGNREKFCRSLIDSGVGALESDRGRGFNFHNHVLLLVDPCDSPNPDQLAALVAGSRREITKPIAAQEEVGPGNAITEAREDVACSALADGRIWGLVDQAQSAAELGAGIRTLFCVEGP